MHSDRVLHRRLQEFVFVIGTQRERTIHFAREFTTIDELTSHLFLPALRTKPFHHRNAQCITARSTCRGPVWVRLCRAASLESAAAVPPRTDTPCAETPYEAADFCRAERTHSARLASNVGLLGDGQSVIDLDTEIANRALDLG